jgi:hypothetical protein
MKSILKSATPLFFSPVPAVELRPHKFIESSNSVATKPRICGSVGSQWGLTLNNMRFQQVWSA